MCNSGELFLTALTMLIVPLVAGSIITGVVGFGDVHKLERMGAMFNMDGAVLIARFIRPSKGHRKSL